jgi:hypothetical protein
MLVLAIKLSKNKRPTKTLKSVSHVGEETTTPNPDKPHHLTAEQNTDWVQMLHLQNEIEDYSSTSKLKGNNAST